MPGNKGHLLFPTLASSNTGICSLNKSATYDCVQNQFKALVMEAGLSMDAMDFGLHSMRRSGALAAVNAHANEHYIQKQMREASAASVRRYATVDNKNLERVDWAIMKGNQQ